MSATRWFVSTRHRGRPCPGRGQDAPPYGTRHARQPGDTVTLCGEAALNWICFWDLPFAPHAPQTCERCSELALAGRRALSAH